MLLNIEQITLYRYLWTLDRSLEKLLETVEKVNYQLQLSDQIGFIIVTLCVLLRAYQLTVIIILIVK